MRPEEKMPPPLGFSDRFPDAAVDSLERKAQLQKKFVFEKADIDVYSLRTPLGHEDTYVVRRCEGHSDSYAQLYHSEASRTIYVSEDGFTMTTFPNARLSEYVIEGLAEILARSCVELKPIHYQA